MSAVGNRFLAFLALGCLLLFHTSCKNGGGSGGQPAPAGGGNSGSGDPGLGPNVVTVLGTTCPSGVGTIPNTSCKLIEVQSEGNTTIQCEIRIVEPDPTVPFLGTVVLCSGGKGEEFFTNINGGAELVQDLMAQGFRVVDRSWVGGWLGTSTSVKQQSLRLALLLDWIVANEHPGGLFTAVGLSGGSAEIAYSLGTWGREDLFDIVVLVSGPPFSRFDYLCPPSTPEWISLCPAFLPLASMSCGVPNCIYFSPVEPSICDLFLQFPSGGTAEEMEEESILHPAADLDYPNLMLHVLIGGEDCTIWSPQGFLFASQILGPIHLEVIPNTPHALSSTPEGRAAIVQALLSN